MARLVGGSFLTAPDLGWPGQPLEPAGSHRYLWQQKVPDTPPFLANALLVATPRGLLWGAEGEKMERDAAALDIGGGAACYKSDIWILDRFRAQPKWEILDEGSSTMFTRSVSCTALMLTLLTGLASSQEADSEKIHHGGCILISPASEAPSDLYTNTGVVPTDEYKPFTKKLSIYGITLIGRDDVSDVFIEKIAKTIEEMFPQGEGIDSESQKDVLRSMYRYRVAIPLFKGEPGFDSDEDWAAYANMKLANSVCDVIAEDDSGRQVMEVVEHILHHVTDIGLHYAFPNEWGISKSSKLYEFMSEAVDKGYYDVSSYGEDENEVSRRVRLQEFAYIVITTAWDLQEPYGGGGNEWTQGGTIANSADLKAKMPKLYEMVEQTVAKIMATPSISTLEEFNK